MQSIHILIILTSSLGTALAVLAILPRLTRQRSGAAAGPLRTAETVTLGADDYADLQDQLTTLRAATEDAPLLIWCENTAGHVEWGNTAYCDMLRMAGRDIGDEGAPLPHLFAPAAAGTQPEAGTTRRMSVDQPGEARKWWFECQAIAQPSGRDLHFALHANPVVRAEEALRNFVQTLTMTFAHLPTGLAIFDRKRQLALFNPALSDLTRLEPEWLSARPTLYGFLDRLRDKRMMPEPKDYKNWRQRMSELERAAADGTYEETWPLPGGQTYRVIGRPHPEGAVAFLIEDITAEISLKRRFRAELELSQSVVDNLEDAVAVFSSAGRLVVSNAAYARLWGSDPGAMLGEMGIVEATRGWQHTTEPTPVWGDLREFVTRGHDRAEWAAEITMADGRRIACRFAPVAGGATLCVFAETAAVPAAQEPALTDAC